MGMLAWLFIRGEQSVRLVRPAEGRLLVVEGPGAERQRREFEDEASLLEFQRDLEERLASEGWELRATHERRSGRDRRAEPRGADRRRGPRT